MKGHNFLLNFESSSLLHLLSWLPCFFHQLRQLRFHNASFVKLWRRDLSTGQLGLLLISEAEFLIIVLISHIGAMKLHVWLVAAILAMDQNWVWLMFNLYFFILLGTIMTEASHEINMFLLAILRLVFKFAPRAHCPIPILPLRIIMPVLCATARWHQHIFEFSY